MCKLEKIPAGGKQHTDGFVGIIWFATYGKSLAGFSWRLLT